MKNKLFLIVLTALVVSFLGVKAWEVRTLEQEINYRQDKVDSFNKVVSNQESKLKEISLLGREGGAKKNNKLIIKLEEAAKGCGLKLMNLTSKKAGEKGPQITIGLEGDYFSLVSFLEKLAGWKKAVKINSLKLEVKGESIQADIKLEEI